MLNFKEITAKDYDIFKRYLNNIGQNSCENAFVNMLIWQKAYNNMYAIEKGQLIIKSGVGEDETFRLPMGDNFELGMELIKTYCKDKNRIFMFRRVNGLTVFSRFTQMNMISRSIGTLSTIFI